MLTEMRTNGLSLAAAAVGQYRQFTVTMLAVPDVLLISARRIADSRGYFMETYRTSDFSEVGLPEFVQENAALSHSRGTLRGLHFQKPPYAQAKLVRPFRGSIFDVAVDLRRRSPSFGQWVGVTLTAASADMLYIPAGFAHGYCTLQDDTEVAYKCDAYYAPEAESGVLFSDPSLGIDWPFEGRDLIVSDKDRELPALRDVVTPFTDGYGQ